MYTYTRIPTWTSLSTLAGKFAFDGAVYNGCCLAMGKTICPIAYLLSDVTCEYYRKNGRWYPLSATDIQYAM